MPSPVRLPSGTVGPLVCGAAFYMVAAGALALTQGVNGIAAFWPANGVLLASLLMARPDQRLRYIAATIVASLVANLQIGAGPIAAVGFTAGNIGEALLARVLVGPGRDDLPSFVAVKGVGRFFLAALAASVASATIATPFDHGHPLDAWSSWVTTDLLGLLIVTPTVVTAAGFVRERGRRAVPEAALLLAGVAAVTIIAFSQSTYPLLFLPLAALLLAMLRLGPFGAAASALLIATIGAAFTVLGAGPLSPDAHSPLPAATLFFQFYLLVLLATSLPIAALIAARDRLVWRLEEGNRLLRLAERSAGVGHWWIAASGIGNQCSPEVMRIHGIDGPTPEFPVFANSYHPDDRDRVAAIVAKAMLDGEPFEYEARLLTPAGDERRVHSRGDADRDGQGRILGLFGTLQDVTAQVRGQRELEAARLAAEQAARLATAAAETDPLTGVANRRKIAALLDLAIDDAHRERGPLSVAMLDLDHFKWINDSHGHLVGDQVLIQVARVAAASLRGNDVVGRIGGEEFVLLLPHADAAQASAIAERVRGAIAAAGSDPDLPRVTASLGVATLMPDEDAAALLNRADGALYAAKRAGRNALRHAA